MSRIVSGSMHVTSAAMPGRSRPRSAKPSRCAGSDVIFRTACSQREDPELAHVDREVARERAPAARVRPVADEDPVAADRVRPVRHRRAHVLLVARVRDARDARLLVGEQLADVVDRPQRRPPPRRLRQTRCGRATTIDRPVHRDLVEAVASPRPPSRRAGARAAPGLAAAAIVAALPPTCIQLGRNACRYVEPARYGYVSSVTSIPSARAWSIIASSSGARPLLIA